MATTRWGRMLKAKRLFGERQKQISNVRQWEQEESKGRLYCCCCCCCCYLIAFVLKSRLIWGTYF